MTRERAPLAVALGNRLRSLRETHGMLGDEAAQKLGVNANTYRAWEQGRALPPTQYLPGILKLYDTTYYYLFAQTNPRGLNPEEQEVISTYRRLRERTRWTVRDLLTSLLRNDLLNGNTPRSA